MAKMEEQQKSRGMVNLEFFSTHPASTKRIQNMTKWMPASQELYSQSNCGNFGNLYGSFQDSFGFGNKVSEPRIISWGI